MDTGNVQWGRICRVTVALPSGSFSDTDPAQNAVVITGADDPDVPGLRIVFKITKSTQKEPNTSEITVYNLAPTTRARLQQKGVRVLVEAGYVTTGLAQIFVGDARTIDHVREGADWKTVIKCGDGERAHRFARASDSFAGGTTVGAVVEALAKSTGLALGNVSAQATKLTTVLYHGWTAHGATSNELDRILRSVGYSYSIQDGALQVLAPGESVSQSIPDIDVTSGLIGSPEMGTPEKKGKPQLLKFKSLLLPQARPGGRVHLKSERYNGIFRARKVEHNGDVRGAEWWTEWEAVQDNSARTA